MSIMQFSGAFSTGTSKKTDGWVISKDAKPGPGAYTPSFYDKPKFPKWRFLKGKRKPMITPSPFPPPWQYDSKSFIGGGLKYSLTGKTMKKSKADNVGPGSYEPKVPLQTTFPAFSFGYKEDPKNMDNKVPGPGTYPKEIDESSLSEKDRLLISRTKLRSEKDKFRKTGFGFSSRDSHRDLKTEMPGPGHYQPRDIDKLPSPSFKFGGENRQSLYSRAKTQPGPGQYNVRTTFGSSHGFSLYGKIDPDFTKNEKKPGPEAYDPKPVKSSSTVTIGTGLRPKFEGRPLKMPGPGAYNPRLIQTAHSFSVGSSNRAKIVNNENPGPGFYGVSESTLGGPRHVIAGKLEKKFTQMKHVMPGPGAYDPSHELVFFQGPAMSIKKDKKMKISPNDVPGPGNYDIRRDLGGNKFSFGGLLKKPKPSIYLEPGPGHYDIPGTIGYIPKYLAARQSKSQGQIPNYFDLKTF